MTTRRDPGPSVLAPAAAAPVSRELWMPVRADGLRPGLVIALAVHVGLVAVLAFGISWKSSQPAVMQAELWAAVPQAAAPREVAPPPPPPVPAPAPTPVRREAAPPAPEQDAQIAVEQRRREEARREQQERERAAREREAREQEAREREAREREQQRQAAARQQRAEQQQRERAAREAAERAEAQRVANLQRLQGLAGASGAPDARGSAQQSAGPSATYAGRIVAAVKPNIVFPDAIAGNPAAEVEVRAGPTGTILGRTLVRSSGVREWDEAVLRAIDRTETLPRDTDGRVPSSLIITFRPRD